MSKQRIQGKPNQPNNDLEVVVIPQKKYSCVTGSTQTKINSSSAEGCLKIATNIVKKAQEYGAHRKYTIDCKVQANPEEGSAKSLEAAELVKNELRVLTTFDCISCPPLVFIAVCNAIIIK